MPTEVVGSWRTDAELYQGRYLMLLPLEVRFGIDQGTVTTHQVSEVRDIGVVEGKRSYRVTYLSPEDKEHWLAILYKPDDKTLRLTNQPEMVWAKDLSFD